MPLRILLVEDEDLIALDLKDILEGAGHDVVGHATNNVDALALARKGSPQVALVDVDLKGDVNGLETAAALHRQFGVMPLFVTGRADFLVRAMALDFEPLGYITKPFREADVLGALAAVR